MSIPVKDRNSKASPLSGEIYHSIKIHCAIKSKTPPHPHNQTLQTKNRNLSHYEHKSEYGNESTLFFDTPPQIKFCR